MSFDIALSGIQAINEQLTTVSHNIANAGTFGFKSGRANFSSLYAGSKPNGAEIGSVSQSIGTNGGTLNTGRGLDASITGRGFFVSRDAQGEMNYSRVGIFTASKEGYLIDSSNRKVQGYAAVSGGALGALGDLAVPTGQIPAVASTKMNYVGNLDADWPIPASLVAGNAFSPTDNLSYNMSKSSVVYDSLGAKHSLTQYFVKTNPTVNSVDVHYFFDGVASGDAILNFDAKGVLAEGTVPTVLSLATANGSDNPINAGIFTLDYTGTTLYAGEAIASTNKVDGYASGTFTKVELADDGSLVAQYTNGEKQTIGTIALATFPNEDALTSVNDTSWVVSSASGTPLYGTPGSGMAGKLATASLEQSNVDITSELVGLMTSQRNYQANSKVISTENAMLQSLMQAL